MMKCTACAWCMCATCHNLETSGEFAPPPPEMAHSADDDHDTEMPGHDNTPFHRTLPGNEAHWLILDPEKTGQAEHAEYNHLHPTRNEKAICSSLQREIE